MTKGGDDKPKDSTPADKAGAKTPDTTAADDSGESVNAEVVEPAKPAAPSKAKSAPPAKDRTRAPKGESGPWGGALKWS